MTNEILEIKIRFNVTDDLDDKALEAILDSDWWWEDAIVERAKEAAATSIAMAVKKQFGVAVEAHDEDEASVWIDAHRVELVSHEEAS